MFSCVLMDSLLLQSIDFNKLFNKYLKEKKLIDNNMISNINASHLIKENEPVLEDYKMNCNKKPQHFCFYPRTRNWTKFNHDSSTRKIWLKSTIKHTYLYMSKRYLYRMSKDLSYVHHSNWAEEISESCNPNLMSELCATPQYNKVR